MIIHEMEQRSPEWHKVRTGKITATSFQTLAAGRDSTVETLCLKTASERITGHSEDSFYTNEAMENGKETEKEALAAYSSTTLTHVREVGFVEYSDYFGCSPDVLVGEDGGVEVKCPLPHTHLKYINADKTDWKWIDSKYRWQIQGSLYLTERLWWDFVSYCPFFPPEKQLIIYRVEIDDQSFEKIKDGMEHCEKRIKEIVGKYDGL